MVRTTRSLVALALFGLAACPEPCPEVAPEDAAMCAPEEPGGVALRNASFETHGAPLHGWSFVEAEGVQVETIAGVDGCTAISLRAPQPLAKPARIVKQFKATALRGQRVRLSMWARVELTQPGRGPNMALRSRAGADASVTELAGKEVVGERWALHSLELDVPPDTDKLEIQVGLSRIRRIDLDGFAIDRIGPACPGCEAAAPLTVRQRENLVAFSRLLGYVRYFHPSVEVESADWDALALVGVQAMLRAESPSDLVAALERVFLPVAPTLHFGAEPGPAAASSLWLAWDHQGGKSHRRPLSAIRERAPAGTPLPDPAAPLRVELGRDVVAWVPIALAWDAAGATRPTARLDRPVAFRADGGDRVTRLAAIALLGARVAHFSPRLELLERPLEDVLRDSFERAAVVSDRYGLRDVVVGVLGALKDGSAQAHYGWDARRMFAMALQWRWIEGRLVITAVDPEHTVKLRIGDVVEAIDGTSVAGALAPILPLTQGRSEARRHVYATSLLARGLAGGPRGVQVRHSDGSEDLEKVPRRYVGLSPADPRPEAISEFDGVMYVDLARVKADELRAAAGRLQAAEAVVLDARWGTDGRARERLAALFGDIGRNEPRHVIWPGGQHSFSATEPATEDFAGTVALPPRVAVLVDERTAGEFEGVADAMRARGAVLVGSPTAAAPGEYTEFTLPGGLMLGMAEAPYDYVSGQPGLEPLQPDIAVTPTVAGIAAGRDEVLERALAGLAER